MRASISRGLGFSFADRRENNLRTAYLAACLARQAPVVVAMIAPSVLVRSEIDAAASPVWIYVKRTLPERPGHWYEPPDNVLTLDHDRMTIDESASRALEAIA